VHAAQTTYDPPIALKGVRYLDRIKYINNRELLAEIDRCKQSYTAFLLPAHQRFDAIVHDITHLTPDFLQATLTRRMEIVTKQGPAVWGAVVAADINVTDLVFRVMTKEHIPLDPTRKRRLKIPSDEGQTRTPFPPYKHYIMCDGVFIEVVRSHWQGDFETGHFDLMQGQISRRLATMFMLLVERYSKRGNWRGYTYVDEMRSHALLQLSQIGLQFDQSKSDNPFAFYTTIIKNCFTRVLNVERRNQHIRDDLLIIAGVQPSYSRQIDHEIEQRFGDQHPGMAAMVSKVVELPKKRGRKPKGGRPAEPESGEHG
jgi:hypothetical protein